MERVFLECRGVANIPTLFFLIIRWTSSTLAIFVSGLNLTADVKKDRTKFMDVGGLDVGRGSKIGVAKECERYICVYVAIELQ